MYMNFLNYTQTNKKGYKNPIFILFKFRQSQ